MYDGLSGLLAEGSEIQKFEKYFYRLDNNQIKNHYFVIEGRYKYVV